MRDPYAYRHVSECHDLPDDDVRMFTPTMRVVQFHCDSPLVALFYDMHRPRRNLFLSYNPDRIPPELVAEMHYQFGSRETCIRILTKNEAALQKVLDIEHEKNDRTSGQWIEPFVALAKVLRAREDIEGVIQEIRRGV